MFEIAGENNKTQKATKTKKTAGVKSKSKSTSKSTKKK
jgi:hypothetical protein